MGSEVLTIKPRIRLLLLVGPKLLIFLFLGSYFFVISFSKVYLQTRVLALFGITVACVTLFFVLLNMLSLKKTEYRFYSNRVEYVEGFLAKEKKLLPFSRITNVGLRKGVIENIYGLGTVYLETAGSSGAGYELSLRYVKNPDAIYELIKKRINL